MWPLWFWVPGWFLTAMIITGNGFVIYLIASRHRLRTKPNWFILSLAIADFSCGATYFPLSAACDIDEKCGKGVARLSVAIFFTYASMTNLCTLTLDRWLAILRPLRYLTLMTKKRIALLITVAWTFIPLLVFLIPYLTWKLAATTGRASEILSRSIWSLLVVFKVLVFAALLSATLQIIFIARRHAKQNFALIKQLGFNHKTEHARGAFLKRTHEGSTTMVVVTLVTVFLIFSSADVYHNSCKFFGLCTDSATRSHVITLLSMMNSAINPVAYAVLKEDFKREFKRMFHCHSRGHRFHSC